MDIERLRKRVAFERFLARLFARDPAPWVLKGGYALEIRLGGRSRSTKDIDLSVPLVENLLDELQEAAELDLGDFFVFRLGRPMRQRAGAPLGGWRFSVEISLAGRPFTGFPLDVGLGDEPLGEVEWREGQADLGFADVPQARVAVYPLADQFAEKLHAYTRPREVRTRVKDLLDLTAILELLGEELPQAQEMRRTIEATFERYGTHPLRRLHRLHGLGRARQTLKHTKPFRRTTNQKVAGSSPAERATESPAKAGLFSLFEAFAVPRYR